MLSKGVLAEEASSQLTALTVADASLPIPHDPRKMLLEGNGDEDGDEDGDVDEDEDAPQAVGPAPGDEALDTVFFDEIPLKAEQAAQERAANEVPPSGFCIAITQRRVRRLHFVGNCGKVPGEHYKTYECWGQILPPEHEIDVTCDVCFRSSKGMVLNQPLGPNENLEELPLGSSSSSSSSSGGSSSEDGEGGVQGVTPKKKAKAKK